MMDVDFYFLVKWEHLPSFVYLQRISSRGKEHRESSVWIPIQDKKLTKLIKFLQVSRVTNPNQAKGACPDFQTMDSLAVCLLIEMEYYSTLTIASGFHSGVSISIYTPRGKRQEKETT